MLRLIFTSAMWLSVGGALLAATPELAKSLRAKSAHAAPGDAEVAHPSEWEIFFEDGIMLQEYAREMDYFKIEIGAVSKDGRVEYISKVSARQAEKRLGDAATDDRLRIGWKKGALYAADRRLLSKAGINTKDKELWHFFPSEIRSQLAVLERAYAKRDPREIQRTRFQIVPKTAGEGYEFVVIEQDPPRPANFREPPAASQNRASATKQGLGDRD